MAPSKPRNHDDSKGDGHKEKGTSKKRQQKDTPVLAPLPSRAATPEKSLPTIDCTKFDREVLHNYRRHYDLDTPPAYLYSSYTFWMALPGSIGLMSPTMVASRKRNKRIQRQTREQLAAAVQTHLDQMTLNETDVMIEFISTLRQQGTRHEQATSASDESLII
ncbi:hypothetical protein TD95_002491 [Thielaviopsis punctulata]|uniref:Histone deacetylase complex subunit SAP30 Sin3 binding domain-containing protein n=1 Tax=Thielaviopsis punctulata TaxID=72032 RepID=A0A0F4ZFB5_9PEZI|nr:hypothetical protein TD95_002491 [Thielaviopsis punctulata]